LRILAVLLLSLREIRAGASFLPIFPIYGGRIISRSFLDVILSRLSLPARFFHAPARVCQVAFAGLSAIVANGHADGFSLGIMEIRYRDRA
jgi:hypothetical protein